MFMMNVVGQMYYVGWAHPSNLSVLEREKKGLR